MVGYTLIKTGRLAWRWHTSPCNDLIELDDLAHSLLLNARSAALSAYAPYSNFRVGAALATIGDDLIYNGCNIENSSYGATMCAERVAIYSAVAAGKTQFAMLALSTIDSAHEPDLANRSPCGLCRQVMSEFFDVKTLVVIDAGDDVDGKPQVDVMDIDSVLPWRFKLK